MQRPLPDPAPHIPHVLPARLLRPPVPLTFSLISGLVLILIGAAVWWSGHHYLTAENNFRLLDIFCAVFAIIGLLLLWTCLYQLRRKLIPPTIAEVSSQSLDRTRPAKFALIQPGPVHWSSLRARLICVDRHTSIAQHVDGEGYQKVKEKKLHDVLLLEAKDVRVPRGGIWHEQGEFTLPEDARPSARTRDQNSDTRGIVWSIEVRGKGPFFGGFIHTYEVRVL